MEGFLMAFAFGTVWFWVISVIWIAFMFWGIESYSGWGSGITFIFYLAFLHWVVRLNVIGQVIHHPGQSLLIVAGYLLVGILWSFVKWWLFVNKDIEEKIDRITKTYIDRVNRGHGTKINSVKELYSPYREEFQEEVKNEMPKIKYNKDKISVWIMYWPLSAIWSLVNDFIKRFVRALVTKLQGVYNGISNSVARSFIK